MHAVTSCYCLTSNSYTLMLAGGRVMLRGACSKVVSVIVAGGPDTNPPARAGIGVDPDGKVIRHTFAVPATWIPARFKSQSCAVSVGLITETSSFLWSALMAAKMSSGYVGLPDGRAPLSTATVPLTSCCGELPLTSTGNAPEK